MTVVMERRWLAILVLLMAAAGTARAAPPVRRGWSVHIPAEWTDTGSADGAAEVAAMHRELAAGGIQTETEQYQLADEAMLQVTSQSVAVRSTQGIAATLNAFEKGSRSAWDESYPQTRYDTRLGSHVLVTDAFSVGEDGLIIVQRRAAGIGAGMLHGLVGTCYVIDAASKAKCMAVLATLELDQAGLDPISGPRREPSQEASGEARREPSGISTFAAVAVVVLVASVLLGLLLYAMRPRRRRTR